MRRLRQLRQSLSLRLLHVGFRGIGLYRHRFYREGDAGTRFRTFDLVEGESDIRVHWNLRPGEGDAEEEDLLREGRRILQEARRAICAYGAAHPEFLTSLEPLPEDDAAPPPAASMLRAARAAAVGPMAAVAGALAETLGRGLAELFPLGEIIVENGGDLWILVRERLGVSVYAGLSSLSEQFSLTIDPYSGAPMPCALACSSGTVGLSLSFGKADAAVVLAADAAAADAWATALGNLIRRAEDLEPAVRSVAAAARREPAPAGAPDCAPAGVLAVLADRMAAAGRIVLGPPPLPSRPS